MLGSGGGRVRGWEETLSGPFTAGDGLTDVVEGGWDVEGPAWLDIGPLRRSDDWHSSREFEWTSARGRHWLIVMGREGYLKVAMTSENAAIVFASRTRSVQGGWTQI